ncbi:MAG: MBOAT family O-acyltransferase [Chloroflexota bacterium]
MNFVSVQFAVLFGAVLLLLLILRSNLHKKIMLLAASAVFYAFWDWRFLGLLALVVCVDYFISKKMAVTDSPRGRRVLLTISLVVSLGLLFAFKYFNFFLDGLNVILSAFHLNVGTLKIILPLGISFYTFSTISYIVDVYRGGQPAESLLDYALFLSFFPRLAAGPIMRANEFLPQLKRDIRLNLPNLLSGAQMFAQGLLKKLVVADRIAFGVDTVYANPYVYSPSSVWVAALSYAVQIYFDFSGYSDMAIGLGRILGFDLPQNFNLPYTAQSITEFWQRWHITLSAWVRDYVFFPLRRALLRSRDRVPGWLTTAIPPLVTMLVVGIWHGADWNFVLWGGLHGLFLAAERLIHGERPIAPGVGVRAWLRAGVTFILVTFALVIFRSSSASEIGAIFSKLFFLSNYGVGWHYTPGTLFIVVVVLGGMVMRSLNFNVTTLNYSRPLSFAVLVMMFVWAYIFAAAKMDPFVYFQF